MGILVCMMDRSHMAFGGWIGFLFCSLLQAAQAEVVVQSTWNTTAWRFFFAAAALQQLVSGLFPSDGRRDRCLRSRLPCTLAVGTIEGARLCTSCFHIGLSFRILLLASLGFSKKPEKTFSPPRMRLLRLTFHSEFCW